VRTPFLLVGLATCAALLPGPALAQDDDCGGASLGESVDVEVRPAHGATGVARDAPIVARYVSAAALQALEASLADDEALLALLRDPAEAGGAREVVPGRIERLDARTVAFVPERRLAAETRYYPLVAKPGFAAAAFTEQRFETAAFLDGEAPELSFGPDDIALSTETIPPDCDGPPGGRRVGVAFPPASDDGDEGSIEYSLYLTRGVDVDGPELRDRARELGGTVRMSLTLTRSQAEERACVAVRVVDGVGRAAAEEPELCFDPVDGGHFEACAAEATVGRTDTGARLGGILLFGAGLALLALRRRRAR
jgi:hypothetical protein